MEKKTKPVKKPISGAWLSDEQQEVVAALQEMTGGKYQVQGLLGPMITGFHPYMFDRKGDLSKAKKALKQTIKRITLLQDSLSGFDELDWSEKIDTQIRYRARNHPLESAFDLVIDNGVRSGVTNVLDEYLRLLNAEIGEYKKRLDDAESSWPEGKTKPQPIHVAREIAEIYVEYNGTKPGYGTGSSKDSEGKAVIDPSTPFSWAVHDIFLILGIDGHYAEAAKFAANEYSDESAAQAKKERDSKQVPLWFKARGLRL